MHCLGFRFVMKALISSQFGYCPLIWMFHNRKFKFESIRDRLRFVYNDHKTTFSELLKKDNSDKKITLLYIIKTSNTSNRNL